MYKRQVWLLSDLADTAIAGVPGRAPGIRIDVPLEAPPLPTTRVRDSVRVGDRSVAITVVDTGLPVVLVRAEDLGAGATDMTRTATELDGNTALHARIEELRRAAAQLVPSLEGRHKLRRGAAELFYACMERCISVELGGSARHVCGACAQILSAYEHHGQARVDDGDRDTAVTHTHRVPHARCGQWRRLERHIDADARRTARHAGDGRVGEVREQPYLSLIHISEPTRRS